MSEELENISSQFCMKFNTKDFVMQTAAAAIATATTAAHSLLCLVTYSSSLSMYSSQPQPSTSFWDL